MIKVKESDMEFKRGMEGDPYSSAVSFQFGLNSRIYESKATHLPTKLGATAFSTESYEDAAKRAMSFIEEQLGVIAAFLRENDNDKD